MLCMCAFVTNNIKSSSAVIRLDVVYLNIQPNKSKITVWSTFMRLSRFKFKFEMKHAPVHEWENQNAYVC